MLATFSTGESETEREGFGAVENVSLSLNSSRHLHVGHFQHR